MKQITIGRSQDNDVVISDPSVSRHHATIRQTANGIVVYDNGSSNGTFINGNRIHEETPLRNNDILKLGTALVPWRNYFHVEMKHEEVKTKIVTEQPTSEQGNYNKNTNTAQNTGYKTPLPARKKSNKGLVIGLSIFAFIVVVLVVLNIIKNSSSSSSSYYDYSVNPEVTNIDKRTVNTGFANRTLVGVAEITNSSSYGGMVEINATCTQEGESWYRTKTIQMGPGEITVETFEFPEIRRDKLDPEFSVDVRPLP